MGQNIFLISLKNINPVGLVLVEPWVRTKHGEGAFSYYAAQRWTNFLTISKCIPTQATFKLRLKTLLLSCVCDWLVSILLHTYHYNLLLHFNCILPILPIISNWKWHLFFLNWFYSVFLLPIVFKCTFLCLCKALWIASVFEICIINKAALPWLVSPINS